MTTESSSNSTSTSQPVDSCLGTPLNCTDLAITSVGMNVPLALVVGASAAAITQLLTGKDKEEEVKDK